MREPIPTLNIVAVWEYLGGTLPHNLQNNRWNFTDCILHGGDSGRIYPDINRFHCFGCGEHGDGYDLLLLKEGIGLSEARELAEERGWLVDSGPTRGPAHKTDRPRRPDRTERGRKPERG